MGIMKKSEAQAKQVNIKISDALFDRYQGVKERCAALGFGYSLQPEFGDWLDTLLAKAEKELAKEETGKAKEQA
ncbi:MAG: hypothetical protein ACEB74_08690 [Desulfovibrio aminophilus]|uniref:hypothetical protein n=1 Tax=Desulfovibrio aminophilus TaxID=81425 RepID=UPI0039E89B3F